MTIQMILLPLFVEVTLTFVLWFWMAFARRQVFVNRTVHPREIALGQQNWPEKIAQVSNSFRNQFELPVLFYVACILLHVLSRVDGLYVSLAWAYVFLRTGQSVVAITYDNVIHRGGFYLLSCVVLWAAWARIAWQLLG